MLSFSNLSRDAGQGAHANAATRIAALGIAHGHLDAAIDALSTSSGHDGLALARLKKKRLHIRDTIAGMLGAGAVLPVTAGDANA